MTKKKPYVTKLTDGRYLVYDWSKRYNRFINTHMFSDSIEANHVLQHAGRVVANFRGYTYT